jgi:hypothetical protein
MVFSTFKAAMWHMPRCWPLLLRLLQVPEHIQRPDYAVTGVPTSELESKQQRAGVPAEHRLL